MRGRGKDTHYHSSYKRKEPKTLYSKLTANEANRYDTNGSPVIPAPLHRTRMASLRTNMKTNELDGSQDDSAPLGRILQKRQLTKNAVQAFRKALHMKVGREGWENIMSAQGREREEE